MRNKTYFEISEREKIEKKIKDLETLLKNVRGSECEVYSRVVGYYRPVKNWNLGKREEFSERKVFEVDIDC